MKTLLLLFFLSSAGFAQCEDPQATIECRTCGQEWGSHIPEHECREVTLCIPCLEQHGFGFRKEVSEGRGNRCVRCNERPDWPKWGKGRDFGFELCLPCAEKHDECFICRAGKNRTREQFWDELCWSVGSGRPRIEDRFRIEIRIYGEKPLIRLKKELGAVDLYLGIAKESDRVDLRVKKERLNALIKKLAD